jgi:hypothetical protein
VHGLGYPGAGYVGGFQGKSGSLVFPCVLSFPFPWFRFLGFYCGQELKERSRCKSLFIRHVSGVWVALARQRALVEEVNKRLS